MEARDTLMNSYDFVVVDYNAAKITDGIMEALKLTDTCGNVEMKKNSLNHIMDDAHKLCGEYSENGKQIKSGKRMEYLYILEHIDHLYKEELKKYVEEKFVNLKPEYDLWRCFDNLSNHGRGIRLVS